MSNPDDTARLKALHDSLVNERHGIVTRLFEQPEMPDAPGLHVFNALAAHPGYFRRNRPPSSRETLAGSGAQFRRDAALWSAFGEVVERYCGAIYFREELIEATADDLNGAAVPLRDFILFADRQYEQPDFPFGPPDGGLRRQWTRVRDLHTGEERLAPAQSVYLGLDLLDRREELVQSNSTGLACGASFEAAALSSLCEVIERDAFSSFWQLGATPARLELGPAMAGRLQPEVLRCLREGPLRIHLWSLTTDIAVPVVLAAAESPRERIFTVGASCRLDAAKAIDKAVVEALHGFAWGRTKLRSGEPIPAEEGIDAPDDHLSFYLNPRNRPRAAFLFAEGPGMDSASLSEAVTDLKGLAARLHGLGFQALIADVTTRDMAEVGLRVTRALIPGLQPLLFGARLRTFDDRRVRRLGSHWRVPFPEGAQRGATPLSVNSDALIDTGLAADGIDAILARQPANPEAEAEAFAEIFHERTKYHRASFACQALRIGRFLRHPPLVAQSLAGYREFPHLEPVEMPAAAVLSADLPAVLGARRSCRAFAGALPLAQVSSLFHHALRCNLSAKTAAVPDLEMKFRPYPSAGSLNALEVYAFLNEVSGVQPCLAHYNGRVHELRMLKRIGRDAFSRVDTAGESQGVAAAMTVVLTMLPGRMISKYGGRGYRFALLEAGHAAQNLCLVAEGLGLGSLVYGSFFDDELAAVLGIDGVSETVATVVLVGPRDGRPKP